MALVNELALHTRHLGADIHTALDAAATKPFGFMRFTPGPGVGGHCLPVDPTYLSWQIRHQTGGRLRLVEAAAGINASMPAYVVRRLTESLALRGVPLKNSRILLLGLAYKPDTADTRDSPTLAIARLLATEGARLQVADPHVDDSIPYVDHVPLRAANLAGSDAVVLVTDHTAFDLQLIEQYAPFVLDYRSCLRSANVERL
ncbi:UDP binding domain-containing protein [Streptomyces sp. Q6]|uniref:UDP binding domain-containing protein n=1 Tax=Streptomyces citrinus TaxID=3118173 RepID=A0ACD5APR6_9ACTN